LALRDDLASIARGAPGSVTWFEAGARARKLSASPVDGAELLRERLFDVVPSVVLTSATLSTPESKRARGDAVASERGCAGGEPGEPAGGVELDGDTALGDGVELPRPTTTGPFRFLRQRLGLYDG